MEETKYYVPDIKEFCVGFQFESLESTGSGKENVEWKKLEWYIKDNENHNTQFSDFSDLETYLIDKSIRCKHLDQQDILDLGWELRNVRTSPLDILITSYQININDVDWKMYVHSDGYVRIQEVFDLDEDRIFKTAFHGKMKNKSLLKMIMEMVGIIETA